MGGLSFLGVANEQENTKQVYPRRISFLFHCLGFVTESQDIANQIFHSEEYQAGIRKMGIEGGLYLSPHAGEFFQGGVLSPCG